MKFLKSEVLSTARHSVCSVHFCDNRRVLLLTKKKAYFPQWAGARRPRCFSFLRSLGWGGGLVVLSGGGTSGRMAFLMSVSISVPGFALSAFLG